MGAAGEAAPEGQADANAGASEPWRPGPAQLGGASAFLAFLLWGLTPLYFKAVAHVPPLEVLAHRVVWAVPLLALLVLVTKRGRKLAAVLARPRLMAVLAVTTVLIACNWGTYIWAVTFDRVTEVSLGYYINPLVNVLLGTVLLRERLRPIQIAAVSLAALGVAVQVVQLGELPIVALVLAFSFGFYGLIHKTQPVEGPTGLLVETALMLPAAGLVLVLAGQGGPGGAFITGDVLTAWLLPVAGVVTVAPLLFYLAGAKRLRYATIGFLQYLAPTCQLILAVAVFGEAMPAARWLTFIAIWLALALYTFDLWRGRPGGPRGVRASPPPSG